MNTPTPFSFDGHGINDANGQRVCKVSSCVPYGGLGTLRARNFEFDELSNLFAAAPELLDALIDSTLELKQMHAVLHPHCTGGCPGLTYVRTNEKVIAKAKGEQS